VTESPKTILVFGAVGTELFIDNRHFELVALSEGGIATWRGRCECCRAPFFVERRAGRLPSASRCVDHRIRSRHSSIAVEPETLVAEVAAAQGHRAPGIAPVEDFVPMAITYENGPVRMAPAKTAMEILAPAREGIIRAHENIPGAAPLFGSVTMHMPDEDATSVTADVSGELRGHYEPGGERGETYEFVEDEPLEAPASYSMAGMLAELEDLAPEGDDEMPPPPDEAGVWIPRLELYKKNRMWLPEWQGRPGEAGCVVPEELLQRFRGR